MSKTPEEMARNYCEPILSDEYAKAIGREDWIGTKCVWVGEGHEMYKAFLAGYKAAQEHAHAELEEAEARHEAYVVATEENFKRLEAKLDHTMGRWISADVQLPEKDGWVLLLSRNESIRVRFMYLSDGCSLTDNGWDELEVTRWMPLPEDIIG